MNNIFDDIDPNDNNMFLVMNKKILNKIIYYNPDFRDSLNFKKNVTFGTEIEFEEANIKIIDDLLYEFDKSSKWITSIDNTLDFGGEISSPVLKDTKKNWNDLKNVCNILRKNAIINSNCGGHIHIGTQILGNNYMNWCNFFRIWCAYEHVIYRFTSNNMLIRPKVLIYAIPLAKKLGNIKEKINEDNLSDYINILSSNKNQAISFQNIDIYHSNKYVKNNTIEFRCPNGTLDVITWQNNICFFVKLLQYSKSDSFDKELINYRYNNNKKIINKININSYSSLEYYNKLYLNDALELCDYIYDNNLDKVNFINQYIKSLNNKR